MGIKGLTLAELLVAMALVLPAAAVVLAAMPQGVQTWENSAAKAEAMQHARIALEEISNELFYARRAEVAAGGCEIIYHKEKGGAVLRYSIYHSRGHILHGLPGGTAVPLAYYIESLAFSPAGTVMEGRPVTVEVTAVSGGLRVTLRTRVTPRNIKGDGNEQR